MTFDINNFSTGKQIPFVKMHGCGNDFILTDFIPDFENISLNDLAIKLCDRNFGIGADGLILNYPSEKADFKMRIINSDGSEPEMCGNGIRCFARYLELSGKTEKKSLTIETLAGIIKPELIKNDGVSFVKVDMGEPILNPEKVPVSGFNSDSVVNQLLEVDEQKFNFTAVSMGNPHCIIYVDNLETLAFNNLGPKIESNTKVFPKKINVEFVKVEDRNNLTVKVWERGAGATLACGTGACAVLVSSVLNGHSEKKAKVHLPGGTLEIEWNDENRLIMTGPAEFVFSGFFGI